MLTSREVVTNRVHKKFEVGYEREKLRESQSGGLERKGTCGEQR
jgi:hypothetical protein